MNKLKRWFITPYILLVSTGLFLSLFYTAQGRWHWSFLVLATLPVFSLTVLQVLRPVTARTGRRLEHFVVLGVVGWAGTFLGLPSVGASALGVALLGGLVLYLFWFSEFQKDRSRFLQVGQKLPEIVARDLEGQAISSRELVGSPALILFYRGNWCPVCVAQIDELAREYDELSRRGIRVVLISPQPETHSAARAKKVGLPFEYWVDEENRAAQRLNIVDPAGLPLGMEALGYGPDTPIPTAILIDEAGTILYSDQAENYRVRPEPKAYLAAFDALVPAGAAAVSS